MTAIASDFISTTPKAMILTATKDVVDALLSLSSRNRRVRARHVDYLEREALEGRYVLTNQGVGIDVDGEAIDGQHRLNALKNAGYPPILLLVVIGLPREARAAIDLGINRSMADLMHFAFERPEANSLMVAIARYWGRKVIGYGRTKASPVQICEWYQDLLPQMEKVFGVLGATRQPAPVLTAVCHRLHHFPNDLRPLTFLEKVTSGAGLDSDSPALRLRNWLQNARGAKGGIDVQDERYDRTATALAAYLEGRTLTKLYARQKASSLASKGKSPAPSLMASA